MRFNYSNTKQIVYAANVSWRFSEGTDLLNVETDLDSPSESNQQDIESASRVIFFNSR